MNPIILDYLSEGQSLIHVGAHYAEEREQYQKKGLNVMWVEACPLFSHKLKDNLARFRHQDFRLAALSRVSGLKTPFHISNNSEGVSSSFYRFGDDADLLWPHHKLKHVDTVTVITKTFDQFVEEEHQWFSSNDPSALLVDIQGAEIDFLLGARGSLWRFDTIQIEASSARVYQTGNTRDEVIRILSNHGFKLEKADEMVKGHGDYLFRRENPIGEPDQAFSSKGYLDINDARLEHLASLDLALENKTILELGSGPGYITEFLIKQGAYVTSIDARIENIQATRQKLNPSRRWNGFVYDVEKEIRPSIVNYDIVLAYGILYHLSNPRKLIERIAIMNPSLFIMETCVTPEQSKSRPEQPSGLLEEDQTNGTQALRGTGCRPVRDWLWELLNKNFANSYTCKHQPAHPQFPTDWSITTRWNKDLTRSVFVCSSNPIDASWALKELPGKQIKKLSGVAYGKSVAKVIGNKTWLDYPRVVSIETMVACNAKCSFCAYPNSERKGERMETELFYKIIEDLSNAGRYPQSITLARINEPLLDKRLREFSVHIRKVFPKSSYAIWSNGLRLDQESANWINELGTETVLQISLNSIDATEHSRFMGIELEPVLDNLDYVHKHTTVKCNLHAPYLGEDRSREIRDYCKNRWPRFELRLRPIFDWQGTIASGISSSKDDLNLPIDYEDRFKDISILNQPCTQWLDLHVLASGYATKCCIDEAGYSDADFSLRDNHTLEVFAKTRFLREEIYARKTIQGCKTCLHPG